MAKSQIEIVKQIVLECSTDIEAVRTKIKDTFSGLKADRAVNILHSARVDFLNVFNMVKEANIPEKIDLDSLDSLASEPANKGVIVVPTKPHAYNEESSLDNAGIIAKLKIEVLKLTEALKSKPVEEVEERDFSGEIEHKIVSKYSHGKTYGQWYTDFCAKPISFMMNDSKFIEAWKDVGITTVGQIVTLDHNELYNCPGIGKKFALDTIGFLSSNGITLKVSSKKTFVPTLKQKAKLKVISGNDMVETPEVEN